MGKYYYVFMKNRSQYRDDQDRCHDTETYKETSKFAGNMSLGYYRPSALAIKNVKFETNTRTVQTRYGTRKETYNEYAPFFMICEDKEDILEDVITGKQYTKSADNNHYFSNIDSNKLILTTAEEIPISQVAGILKNITKEDVARYIVGSNNLDKAIAYGYQMDQIRMSKEAKQTQSNESFIQSFKNRYGK